VVAHLEERARQEHVAISCDIAAGLYVVSDPLALDVVVRNVLENALEIWGAVLSRPEPGLAIASFGRRDVPFDAGLPQPVKAARIGAVRPFGGGEVIALSDQHAHVRVPGDADLRPGDLLGATISHPCGALDRWRLLYRVDDAYGVLGGVETWF